LDHHVGKLFNDVTKRKQDEEKRVKSSYLIRFHGAHRSSINARQWLSEINSTAGIMSVENAYRALLQNPNMHPEEKIPLA
jgi:hypothetical protein